MRRWGLAASLVWGILATAGPAAGLTVALEVRFKAKGHQESILGVRPQRFGERELINYIRGQALDEPVPKNLILVAGVECSDVPGFSLQIWDEDLGQAVAAPNTFIFTAPVSVPSSKKTPGAPGSKRDVQVEASTTDASYEIEFSGVMRFTYKALPKKLNVDAVCPVKGKSRTLSITVDHPNGHVVLTGRLSLGKPLDTQ